MNRRNLLAFTAGAATLFLTGARAWGQTKLALRDSDVFVVVDVQNCFVPGGSLAVK
jgi:nicotinamidase/pyrazinamidase